MTLEYEKNPPTADDVKLSPRFVRGLSNDSDEDIVVFTVGQEDAYKLAIDMERDQQGYVDLGEVRRGLTHAAEVLTNEYTRSAYLKGVESFIERNKALNE